MKKLIHVLNINDFFPELFALTFPTIQSYAQKHGFQINLITERKFPDYPINYEKMQVFRDGMGATLNMLCDADMLIHPEFPDVEQIVNPKTVAFNDNYNISQKYRTEKIPYFVRDGRDVGIATNFVVTSNITHDLWEPLPLSPQQICDLAVPNNDRREDEWNRGWGHYADEFALSFNLAKYGLKYQGICPEDWQRPYLIHVGTGDTEKSLRIARETVAKWATLK